MKALLGEVGGNALLKELSYWDGYVSSSLLAVESIRACARHRPRDAQEAREWLEGVSLLPLDDRIMDKATELNPVGLRSLDALHLATALSVRDEIGALFTYDERLGRAAVSHGLEVASPT